MPRNSFLRAGRSRAEASMADACTIRRRGAETEGPGGVMVTAWSDVYSGRCRVQVNGRVQSGTNSDVGEAALILATHEIQLPISAAGILEGDEVTMTASANDPDLVGRVYAVRTVLTKSEATSRRVTAVEVTS